MHKDFTFSISVGLIEKSYAIFNQKQTSPSFGFTFVLVQFWRIWYTKKAIIIWNVNFKPFPKSEKFCHKIRESFTLTLLALFFVRKTTFFVGKANVWYFSRKRNSSVVSANRRYVTQQFVRIISFFFVWDYEKFQDASD